MPKLLMTSAAERHLAALEASDKKKARKVKQKLGFLEHNPKHPSLETHEFTSLKGAKGEKVFEAYVENHTPQAYRIFWHWGPGAGTITVLAITPHP